MQQRLLRACRLCKFNKIFILVRSVIFIYGTPSESLYILNFGGLIMLSLYIYDNVNRERDLISSYDSVSEMLQDLADHLYYDAADHSAGRYIYQVIYVDVRAESGKE